MGRVIDRELVAHGRRSATTWPVTSRTRQDRWMTSLGLFVTDLAYIGQNGDPLRLRGLDLGINDHAYDRAMVLHGAAYVSEANATRFGRLGRSWGRPACTANRRPQR